MTLPKYVIIDLSNGNVTDYPISEELYTKRFLNIIDERVFISGIRLAHVIHRLLQKESQTTPMIQLKNAIINIVGDFYNFVSLKPRIVTN